MVGAHIGALLNTHAKNGASRMAAPIRHGAIEAGAALLAGFLALAGIGCVTAAVWIFAGAIFG